jgi:hypothetical protein
MNVLEFAKKYDFKVFTDEKVAEKREIKGCYIGDLLSLAMAKVEEDNVWITIQTNLNIVAVASFTIFWKHRENIGRLIRKEEIGLRSTMRGDKRLDR